MRRPKLKWFSLFSLSFIATLMYVNSSGKRKIQSSRYYNDEPNLTPIEWDFGDITYGITIVHCHETEKSMAWLEDIPKDWNIVVYEKCDQHISPFSKPVKNIGSEECTAYLTTMIDQYDDLPDINLFVQADVLLGFGRRGKLSTQHSPFAYFPELVDYTHSWAKQRRGKYLAYGPEIDLMKNINRRLYFYHWYVKELFDRLGLEYTKDSTDVHGRSGACFAVHRDRILLNKKEKYIEMKESLLSKEGDVPQILRECSTLENTWHLVLGEDYVIPRESTVEELWEDFTKIFGTNRMMGKPGGYETRMDVVKKIWPGFSKGANGRYKEKLVNVKK